MRHLVECWLVVSLVLTALAGAIGLKVYRFPSANVFVALIHERQPSIYLGLSYIYATLWFSTSFLMLSGAFSSRCKTIASLNGSALVIHPLTRCPSPIDRLAQ